MNVLDRIGMRWLIVSIAVLPMALASATAVRLSSIAAEAEQEARADLQALDRLIALGDYRTSVINETASYRGWTTAIVPSDIDQDTQMMSMARMGLTRLAESGSDGARSSIDEVDLTPAEADLVERIDTLLTQLRADFAADTDAPILPQLAAIDALVPEIEAMTARLVDRRSDDWTVVDLHAEMMSRLANEVFIVGTMLISGESTADSRQDGALLVGQTDETFERLLGAVDDAEQTALLEAFDNDYTAELRHTVASLPERFEPLSVMTIASAPGDLARFGSAADEVRSARATTIRDDAASRASQASNERLLMLAIAIIAIVVPGLLLIVIARRISRRLRSLTDAAKRLSEGELGVMAAGVDGTDELALLAETFNEVSATVSLGHDQISALADGRLDDPVLEQQMPGPVGHTLRVALRRLGNATAELTHHASHDRLTGLRDRRGFHLAELELDPDVDWAIMLIDLDGFKAVNDTFGHAAGDDVLVTVAERLVASTRTDDVVARLGGDEFAAFVDRSLVEQVAERLLLALAEPITVAGDSHAISASIGWTPMRPNEDVGTALRRADDAMYDAKRSGRNRVRVRPMVKASADASTDAMTASLR